MMADIPHLPAEIHRLIAQYVHREDLPSYRLANKQLCIIGTEELFSTIVFHYSTASIGRLEELGASERLRGCVKTIFWDINLWKIPGVSDLREWEIYFGRRANFCLNRIIETSDTSIASGKLNASKFTELSKNRREWEGYLDKVDDEKKARKASERLQVLGCFQKVQCVHIVNGDLVPAHRGLKKVADRLPHALPAPPVLRRGECTYDKNRLPGVEALRTVQRRCNSSLGKLKLDRVHPKAFASALPSGFSGLTNLNIKMIKWSHHVCFNLPQSVDSLMGNLRMFLVWLPQLESLQVSFDDKMDPWGSVATASPTIRNVFGSETTWSKLQKLSLCGFAATSNTLVALLDRHSSTLKDLSLCDIFWAMDEGDTPEEGREASFGSIRHCAWPQTLQEIGECVSLEHATVSGTLGVVGHMLEWRLDENPELAADVENYLVHGGQCPLTADNAVSTIDGCELSSALD
jgi:hypothetical protein